MLRTYKRLAHEKLWLAGLVILSGAIQFSFISKSSIWHDEGYTLMLAPQSWADIITRTARDVHPPLHYLTLNGWMQLFGNSEAAVRGLSVVFILASIVVGFYLVKRLINPRAARIAALFMAVAPFLVRYGQEARMYAMVAFLLLLATYVLVQALDNHSKKQLYLYAVIMALAFYTHYYTIFMVPVHWLYVLIRTKWHTRDRTPGLVDARSIHWWLANGTIVALFAPWLPSAYGQFTRVQGGFWIPPVGPGTLPNTLFQMTVFTGLSKLALWARVGIASLVAVVTAIAIYMNRHERKGLMLLAAYAFTGPVAVFLISLVSRPVYIDRYFVFAAMGLFMLLAALLYVKPLNYLWRIRLIIIIALVAAFGWGIRNVYVTSTHQMRQIGNTVSQQFEDGDALVAGELYVYLDFTYYNQTGQELVLYAPGGVSGYGETSLLYDRSDQLVTTSYNQIDPSSGQVWLIGKVGDRGYLRAVPDQWELTKQYQAGESAAYLYTVTDPAN